MEWWAIVLTGLFSSGGLVAFIKMLSDHKVKMKELELQNKQKDETIMKIFNQQTPLEYDPIFATIDEIEHFFLMSFSLPDEGRTAIIREACVNYLRVWRSQIKKYVVDSQMCFDNCGYAKFGVCNKSENSFRKLLIEGSEMYMTVWDMPHKLDVYGHQPYDEASLNTMKVFLPIFQSWNMSVEEVIRLASTEIPNSGMNHDCYNDWKDILIVYRYSFVQMKYDALNAMKSLNGEITGKYFLGLTVGDLPH